MVIWSGGQVVRWSGGPALLLARTGKAPEDVQTVEVWKGGALHRSFNMKVHFEPGYMYNLFLI